MSIEFTQENFSILFDEEQNVIEIQYQGVNAALLAALQADMAALEAELDAALSGLDGQLGTLQNDLDSLTTLTQALGADLSQETVDRLAGDNLLGAANTDLADELASEILDVTNTFGAAIIAEAAARNAAIASATSTIITDVAALAISVSGLAADMGTAQASIIDVELAIATETSARAAQYSALTADFGDTNAAILEESVVRADADAAMAYDISILMASSGNTTFHQNSAPSSGMTTGDVWYDADDGNKPYRYNGSSWVAVQDTLITTTAAAVVTEASARASADSALSSSISTVSASVSTEASTRSAADSSLSSSISTVSASVSTEASARASADGVIESKYTVKVDANGHIAGYGLIATANNGTPTSAFVVTAGSFQVYNGSTAEIPFEVVGGVVYIKQAKIEALTVSKLSSGTLDAVMNVGTGKIIWSNGTYMKVTGVGFGSSSQFIEWYGPYFASLSSCTEANAIQYLKTNGAAYFGGSLLAGTLTNSGTTSLLSTTAQIIVGPFSTNGGNKSVACSLVMDTTLYQVGTAGGGAGTKIMPTGVYFTVTLYRSLGGGAETNLGSHIIYLSIGTELVTDPTFGWTWAVTASDGWSITDTSTSMATFTYRLAITSVTYVSAEHSMSYGFGYQKLGLISVEA